MLAYGSDPLVPHKLDSYKVRIAPGAVSGEIHLDVLDLRQRLSEVVSLTSNQ